ncbi:MAG: DoxX family protein [Saprospiraceae bacterium]
MFKKLLSASRWSHDSTDWVSLILRLSLGGLMLNHGIPKFLKLIHGDFQFGDPIGLGAKTSLVLAVFAEFLCSILLALGLYTRFTIIPLAFTMFIAAFVVLQDDSFSGKENALLFLLPYVALFLLGSGRYSLDAVLFKRNRELLVKQKNKDKIV